MSRPPDEDPPNTRVERLFDANEHSPTIPPDAGTTFADAEEITKVETPVPQRQPEARKETKAITLGDIWDALGKLTETVSSLDAGVKGLWFEAQAVRGDMRQGYENMASELSALRADMNTGINGARSLIGAHATALERVAKDVGLMREQHESFGAAVSALPPRLAAIEDRGAESLRLSCAAFDVAVHNEIPDDELQACETIVAAARRAAR